MSDTTKTIILSYLFLFLLVIIPVDIDGCFRTIKIIQDNIRPFVVVFITLSATIYLKIYNDVEKKHNDDIEKFKKDFFQAYDVLQNDIKEFKETGQLKNEKNCIDVPLRYIRTDLRYLMKERIINKKCVFYQVFENFLLWKKPEKLYACDCFLQNGKNLLQDCFDEIISKSKPKYQGGIRLEYADLEDVQFRNVCITNDDNGELYIAYAKFDNADFSNSKIIFESFVALSRTPLNSAEEYRCGSFCKAKFEKSDILFHFIVHLRNTWSADFPKMDDITSINSNFNFLPNVQDDTMLYNVNIENSVEKMVSSFKEFFEKKIQNNIQVDETTNFELEFLGQKKIQIKKKVTQ